MAAQPTDFVPAAGRHGLTALYDPVVALTMREGRLRHDLRRRLGAQLPESGIVVDVGCGTGSNAIALAAAGLEVIGVDPDRGILDTARAKEGGERVDWREGRAETLPVEPAGADAVVMSLLLHHLQPAAKSGALREARRVLRPGGHLYVADWGAPAGPATSLGFLALQVVDGFATTADHRAGRLAEFLAGAGFPDATRHGRVKTVWGVLEQWSAQKRDGG